MPIQGRVQYRQGRRYSDNSKPNEYQLTFTPMAMSDVAPEDLQHWYTPDDMLYVKDKKHIQDTKPMEEFACCL